MAFTTAEVYSSKLDQVFTLASMTNDLNNDGGYSFTDAQTIRVETLTTEAFVAYSRTQTLTSAIADVTNVANTTATYVISQYKKNLKHFDFFDELEQPAATVAKFEMAVTDERYTPMIDAYRIAILTAAATSNTQKFIATANGYTDFLKMNAYLTNAQAPRTGRIVYGNTKFETNIKLDPHFVPYTSEQLAKLRDGSIGYIDNVKVVILPDSYFPGVFNAVEVHKDAVFGPRGIKKAVVKEVPAKPGKNVEMYARYDLFVLAQKTLAISAITAS